MSNTAESSRKAGAAVAWARAHSRQLLYVGAALAVVAFLLPWWGLTKYRVYEQRGVNLADATARAEIEKDMSPEDKKEYYERIARYEGLWLANASLNRGFYLETLGQDFEKDLRNKENVTLRSGSSKVYGWSLWTGWFGVLFIVVGIALAAAVAMSPPLAVWAWAVPWVWTLLAFVYLAASVSFYFSVPDRNDDGYAQGISLGNYLAILGGLAALVGAVFEGMRTAQQRLAELETAPPVEEAASEPPPPDPEAERRRKLNEW